LVSGKRETTKKPGKKGSQKKTSETKNDLIIGKARFRGDRNDKRYSLDGSNAKKRTEREGVVEIPQPPKWEKALGGWWRKIDMGKKPRRRPYYNFP